MEIRLILFTLFLFMHSTVYSNVPDEKFFISKNNLPKELLKKTIGIITVSSGIKRNVTVDLFNDNFIKTGKINLRDNSLPVSNFGYHPPDDTLISNFRYLITDENENFLKVVYDHNHQKHAWVSKIQLSKNFYSKIKYTDDLKTDYGEFVSLFELLSTDYRKVYNQPDKDSDFEFIREKDCSGKQVKILEQKGEFLKMAIVNEDCDNTIEIIKELGWIKIKDETGALSVWIVNIDLC